MPREKALDIEQRGIVSIMVGYQEPPSIRLVISMFLNRSRCFADSGGVCEGVFAPAKG